VTRSDTTHFLVPVVLLSVIPLLSLHQHPLTYPEVWATIESACAGAAVLLNIANGPGSGLDPTWTTAAQRLARSGATVLGYVDLGYGVRPVERIRAELGRWAGYPLKGIFFDQAPTSPYSIGPVAVAVRSARRIGFDTLVVSPGCPADSIYRGLGAALCTFEGGWDEYQVSDTLIAGDVHLVHSVPVEQIGAAHALMRGRGARMGLATSESSLRPSAALV
jgi:hypothetical protein